VTHAVLTTLPWQAQQQLAAAYISQQFQCSSSLGSYGRGRNRGRGRGRFSGGNYGNFYASTGRGNLTLPSYLSYRGQLPSVQCQICQKSGHVPKDCWNRYDDDATPSAQVHLAQLDTI
jgi:hypothetical protein